VGREPEARVVLSATTDRLRLLPERKKRVARADYNPVDFRFAVRRAARGREAAALVP
jgi:hypothetical protein